MKTDYPSMDAIIKDVIAHAARHRWRTFYDSLADAFYWTRQDLSKSARLTGLSGSVSFYITPEMDVEGVFIQPFRHHFLNEHDEIAEFKKDVPEYMPEFLAGKLSASILNDISRDAKDLKVS